MGAPELAAGSTAARTASHALSALGRSIANVTMRSPCALIAMAVRGFAIAAGTPAVGVASAP